MQTSNLYHATGGAKQRDLTYTRCSGAYLSAVNADSAGFESLDAPSWLPAGACDSIEYLDWKGRSIPHAQLFDRDNHSA